MRVSTVPAAVHFCVSQLAFFAYHPGVTRGTAGFPATFAPFRNSGRTNYLRDLSRIVHVFDLS